MKNYIKDFLLSERGDTNYVAIVIILFIILVIAANFKLIMQYIWEIVSEDFFNFLSSIGFR